MKVLVVSVFEIAQFPPIQTLCQTLRALGHAVTLLTLCNGTSKGTLDGIEVVDLGPARPSGISRVTYDQRLAKKVKSYCRDHGGEFDIIWTTSDLAARDCGRELYGHCYVIQLMELAEYVPVATQSNKMPHSNLVPELARRAHRVVVPEYNRSFIQQAWWDLPVRPAVLPNKPLVVPDSPQIEGKYLPDLERMQSETRRILLYQGVFTADRNFSGFLSASDRLGDDFAFFLMGVRDDSNGAALREQVKNHPNVETLPFIPAPQHLAFTKFGGIGLLPYRPSPGRQSPLNALYCAPNKIWEYARFGLPMIGSEVPGLTSIFERGGIGITCDIDDPDAIVQAAQTINLDYDAFSCRSRAYYDSIDVVEIVRNILEGA